MKKNAGEIFWVMWSALWVCLFFYAILIACYVANGELPTNAQPIIKSGEMNGK